MKDIIEGAEFLGMPMTIILILVGVFFAMQIIGELLEFKGKVVPEFLKIRKFFSRKKQEKKDATETLKEVKQLLNDVNQHYSQDNINKRNDWMKWVNDRAIVYDESIHELKEQFKINNEITLDLYINVNRNRIIDFANKVIDNNVIVSREEFNRIFKIHDEYEDILKKYGKKNGEVDISFKIINEAYEDRVKNHTFLENIRGYE